jgi:hypothetical protein
VKQLLRQPRDYALSFVHARVPGFGNALRALSFYGDDLAGASLFREHADLLVCYTCGLRKAAGGTEILRLGVDGNVSFFLGDQKRLRAIEDTLRFLRDERRLVGEEEEYGADAN